jgi:hypothetical protein
VVECGVGEQRTAAELGYHSAARASGVVMVFRRPGRVT